MFCKRCGKEIPNDSNVCQYCGSQVTPRTSANTYTNFNNTTVNQAPSAPQKNQKKTPWKIIAPVVAVLLIIAIVFGVFACANNKKKAAEEKLRQILEESTTKPIVEFMCEDYDGDGRYEAFAVVGESEEKAEYIEYSEADICHVNEEEAEVIKESVRGHSNGTIEVGNTIYVSLEVYDDGVETGKSFIYTSEDNKYVEPDVSGKYANVHEEDGKILGKDENGNEIEVELTDRNEEDKTESETENLTEATTTDNSPEVGEYIKFGKFEQDNDTSNGAEEIEWLVLEKQGDKMLVISRYILDARSYNPANLTETCWEDCELRRWLNGDFFNTAFTSEEQGKIPVTTVTADPYDDKDDYQGDDTEDKVFLLSNDEAERYFTSDRERLCKATAYTEAKGIATDTYNGESYGCSNWWLRTMAGASIMASYVMPNGSIFLYNVSFDTTGVRPALWVTL